MALKKHVGTKCAEMSPASCSWCLRQERLAPKWCTVQDDSLAAKSPSQTFVRQIRKESRFPKRIAATRIRSSTKTARLISSTNRRDGRAVTRKPLERKVPIRGSHHSDSKSGSINKRLHLLPLPLHEGHRVALVARVRYPREGTLESHQQRLTD